MPGESRGRACLISALGKHLFHITKLADVLFFPSFCKLCSSLLEEPQERVVCNSCWEKLVARVPSHCLCCGRFFGGGSESYFCPECVSQRPAFSLHRSCGRYEGTLKDIILLFKYGSYKVLGKKLAFFAHRALKGEEDLWWKVEEIIPVPLQPKRERERGFNQAQVVARELARLRGVPCREEVLIKVKHVFPQTSLEAEERKQNVKGAFGVRKEEQIKGKIVILLDDVYTTGSTLEECSRVLREAGVEEVRAISLAQA